MSFEVGDRVMTLPNSIALPYPDSGIITGKRYNLDGGISYVLKLDKSGSGWTTSDEFLDYDWDEEDIEEEEGMSWGRPPIVEAVPIGTSKRKPPVVNPTFKELTGGLNPQAAKKKPVQVDENFVPPAHHVAPITEAQKILLLIGS